MTTHKPKPAAMPPEGEIGGDALNRPAAKRKPRAITPDTVKRTPNDGRRTKLNDDVQERICRAIRAGNYYYAAAAHGGITYEAFRGWMIRGIDEVQRLDENPRARPSEREAPFVAFLHAVTLAEADAEVRLVATWSAQAAEDWRAARDLLARRYPDRWGVTTKVEHTGAEGGPLEIVYTNDWRAKPGDATADGEPVDADAVTRGVMGFVLPAGAPTFEDGPDDDDGDDDSEGES